MRIFCLFYCMKKFLIVTVFVVLFGGAFVAWLFLLPATLFSADKKALYITAENITNKSIDNSLAEQEIVRSVWAFNLLANQLNVYKTVKAGKFTIESGSSLLNIVRQLRNNKQAEVKLVINKLRTKAEFAAVISKNFSTDSITTYQFISNNDSIAFAKVDSNVFTSIIIPNTYSFYWNTPLQKIIEKLYQYQQDFWNEQRLNKATALGLTPTEVYTIASIVEEETNMQADKGKIASVYINRLKKGMALGADPTIKFALQDFSIKRVLYGHLQVQSPYNTYKNKGLPPGPICTPSIKTIDAVLQAPTTDYIFFVAKPDFSGYSNFSNNYTQHLVYAKQYQQALDAYLQRKQNQ
jgi:UPF0755 protein